MFSKCKACIEVVHAGIRTSKERRGLLTPLRFFGVWFRGAWFLVTECLHERGEIHYL